MQAWNGPPQMIGTSIYNETPDSIGENAKNDKFQNGACLSLIKSQRPCINPRRGAVGSGRRKLPSRVDDRVFLCEYGDGVGEQAVFDPADWVGARK